jgi:hypothetical protein
MYSHLIPSVLVGYKGYYGLTESMVNAAIMVFRKVGSDPEPQPAIWTARFDPFCSPIVARSSTVSARVSDAAGIPDRWLYSGFAIFSEPVQTYCLYFQI